MQENLKLMRVTNPPVIAMYWIPEQDRWSSPIGSEFPKRSGTRHTTYMRH